MGEGGEEAGNDVDDDHFFEDRDSVDINPILGFTFTSTLRDNLASLLYLGNQLGLTTFMVGDVVYGVGLVGCWSGDGVYVGPVGQLGGAMGSISSCKISILRGCLLPASVKLNSSAFSTYLGNQLGITFMVRGYEARHWDVLGCLARVRVFGETAVPGEGWGMGVGNCGVGARG